MSTSKSIAFAAPYRSSTFNDNQSLLTGLNGVVTGGSVTTSGSVATIQPLSFVQNGLLTTCSGSLSATIPAGLTAPYSIAVTVSSSVENLAEVITPTFVKRPRDVSANTVIVADYDGAEWVARPKVQIREQILASQVRALRQDFFGVAEGLNVSKPGSTVNVDSGSLIDRQGLLFTKTLATAFTPVGADVDSLGRIDEVLYRRPDDDTNRSGTLQYVTGQTYNSSDTVSILHQTQIGNGAKVNRAGKTLIVPGTNQSLFLFKEDYGSRSKLQLRTSPDLMTSVVASVTIASNFSDFDAILNPDGSVDVVYSRGTALFYQRVTIAGASVFAETQIATQSVVVSNPKLVSVKSGTTYFLHIVYEASISSGDHRLFYARRSSANTTETASVLLVSLSAVITNPSLEKDDDDALILLAYENSTSQRVYLRQYDAASATGVAAPSQLGTTLELQDDTYRLSTTSVLATSGATQPKVKRANNKDTYVFWRHNKGSGNYGIAVYTSRYLATQGHKAVLQDLTGPSENIGAYDVDTDGMNSAHFILSVGGNVIKSSLKLEALSVLGVNGTLDTTTPTALCTTLNAKGALVQSWSYASAGTTNNGTAKTVQFVGPGTFLSSEAISSGEFVLLATDYAALPIVPAVGDSVTLASAGPDNGTYSWLAVRSFTILSVNYVAVSTSGTFTSLPSGPTAQFLVQQATNLYVAKTTSGISSNLRGFDVLHTDIWLAHYRSTDSVLAVSGPIIEENTAIARLYEFFNCFAGSGQISWNIVGSNKLAASSAIKFFFFNRKSLYQISAFPSGVTITNGQVAYIQIPDTDTAATLTLQVANFGDGILDRSRKNTVPLFWNIDGVLYTRFAPFRLDAGGETIILGDQLSQEFINWVGSGDSTPDATNHAYSSISGAGLLQSDNHNVAIGKLDAAIQALSTFISPLPISSGGTGQTTKTAAFDALSPQTTKGDLVTFDGTNAVRKASGTNGQFLTADSTQSDGLRWINSAFDSDTILVDDVTGQIVTDSLTGNLVFSG